MILLLNNYYKYNGFAVINLIKIILVYFLYFLLLCNILKLML